MEYFIVSIFGSVATLFWLGLTGLVLYFVWIFIRTSVPVLQNIGPSEVSPLSVFLTILLLVAVNLLFSKIWFDLARLAGAVYPVWDNPSDVYLMVLIYRSIFVGITSFVALFFLGKGRGTRYGIITLPYFIISLIFLVWLLFEVCRYLVVELKSMGIYIVLVLVILIFSGLILFVQKQYEAFKNIENKLKSEVSAKTEETRKNSLPQI